MAYDIIGAVHKIGTTENIPTKNGSTFQRRSITIIQRRFDQNTGEEFEPNYPTIEFSQQRCAELDRYKTGDKVRIRFDLSGTKYEDKNTHEEKYFTSLRGFRIEPFVAQQQQSMAQPAPQPMPQHQGQQYQPQAPYAQPTYPPQGGYQHPAQQPQYPPQQDNGLPF